MGDNSPPSPSAAERAEKKPRLEENGTANGTGDRSLGPFPPSSLLVR
jgi:hypothetical protein